MSFVSNVYIIKTLSTAKALTLQESQVYRDVSEMDIYSDTYLPLALVKVLMLVWTSCRTQKLWQMLLQDFMS